MEKKLQKISYILQLIDSARFMASPLSNLVSNRFVEIQDDLIKYKCLCCHMSTYV